MCLCTVIITVMDVYVQMVKIRSSIKPHNFMTLSRAHERFPYFNSSNFRMLSGPQPISSPPPPPPPPARATIAPKLTSRDGCY